jgi:hypothetical protein
LTSQIILDSSLSSVLMRGGQFASLGYHYGTTRDLAPKFAQLVGYVLYFTLVESIPVHVERSVQIQVEGVPFEIKW